MIIFKDFIFVFVIINHFDYTQKEVFRRTRTIKEPSELVKEVYARELSGGKISFPLNETVFRNAFMS